MHFYIFVKGGLKHLFVVIYYFYLIVYRLKQINCLKILKTERTDKDMNKIPIWEKLNLTVEEAAEYSNIGVNKMYEMVNEPSCPFILYVGHKRVIKRKEFERYIEKVSRV